MKLHYSLVHDQMMDAATRDTLIDQMKKAGIEKIWLLGFLFGGMMNVEELKQAKAIAEQNGLEVGAITLPVGHPGNCLNPDDTDIALEIPKHWHYRIDKFGQTVYYCGAIDTCLIKDNVKAIELLRDAGFKQVFLDDDLRTGNCNADIEGCYCDVCVAEFHQTYHRQETRETLKNQIVNKQDTELIKDWVSFQCSKVTEVMKASDVDGIQTGIMVMYFGDERHGIDIPAIREQVPSTMFRVGESHFNDQSFGSAHGKANEMMSILYHLNFIDRKEAYSETTVFPPRSLKEHNLVYKVKMAIAAGLENIFLMSGTWTLDENYWKSLATARPILWEFDKACADSERKYPVHISYGTHGIYAEAFVPMSLPLLAGLPAKPVRADQSSDDGELLLFFGDYQLSKEWQEKLPHYKKVVFDKKSALKNRDILQQLIQAVSPNAGSNFVFWDYEAGAWALEKEIFMLRELVNRDSWDFPRIIEGNSVGLIWLKDSGKVILFNLLETENQGVLNWADIHYQICLKPLSFAILDRSGSLVTYDTEVV
jgi:hypothetical protein